MDFKGLNKSSTGKYPENIKLSELPLNEAFKIVNFKEISTKFGPQLVIEIKGRKSFFSPSHIKEYLLSHQDALKTLRKLALRGYVSAKSLGGSGVEFKVKNAKKCTFKPLSFIYNKKLKIVLVT